jgi:hypothetical protein
MHVERTSDGRRKWGGAAGTLALALMFGVSGSTVRGQHGWPFHLEWREEGQPAVFYRLCVNGQCSVLDAFPVNGTVWRARLPVLPQGEHRLVVEACGGNVCVPGTPDLMIRVVPPGGRRPPIDVVSGPRVGVGNR